MKKFFIITAAFMSLSSLIAQTFLTQDFGRSKTQVLEFLSTKYLVRTTQTEESTLVAATEAYTVTYYFEEGQLYKIETVADIGQKREAIDKMAAFKLQFLQENAEVLNLNDEKELTRFAALQGRELHEVSAHAIGKNGTQIRLVSLDLDRAPGTAMNDIRQDNLLFSMLHR